MRFKDFIQENSKPRPLYVCRPVINTDDIISWAKSQGLTSMLEPNDLHVTICYSRSAMSWDMPEADKEVVVPAISDFDEDHKPVRKMEMFGKEHNVLVIQLESEDLKNRWQEFLDHGASYDFPDYKPHITISYKASELAEDIEYIEPYRGKIVFGPEKFKAIDQEWAGEAEEIDLTKPLSELIGKASVDVAETYLDFIGDNRFLNENTEWAGNIRVTVNPSQAQLETMCDQYEVRGVCDGKDVFVWDAYAGIHMEVMHKLGIPADYYANRFFAWMPSFGGGEPEDEFADSEWLDSRDNVRIEAGACIISVRGQQYNHLMSHRGFSRMVKGGRVVESADSPDGLRFYRNPTELPKGNLAGVRSNGDIFVWSSTYPEDRALRLLGLNEGAEVVTGQAVAALLENSNGTPKYFWFVTDIPRHEEMDDIRTEMTAKRLRDLSTGVLTGLRGISGTREIITQMLDIKGNTVIMMNAEQVMRYNRIEQVLYDDADWLASNNCSALFRIWEKDYDKKFSRESLIINLWHDISRSAGKESRYIGNVIDTFSSPVAKMFGEEGFTSPINSAADLSKYLYGLLLRAIETPGYYSYRKSDLESFTFAEFSQMVSAGLLLVGSRYSDEGEWLVHSETFTIPPGSRMLVSADSEMLRRAKTGDVEGLPLFRHYEVKGIQRVLEHIKRYDLTGRYDLRFIPQEKFAQVRHAVQGRRYNKKG